MVNQVGFNSPNITWQSAAICLLANATAQLVASKISKIDEKNPTIQKVATLGYGLIIGAAVVIAIASPLADRFSICINHNIVMQVALCQTIIQVIQHHLFPRKVEVVADDQPLEPGKLSDLKSLLKSYDSKWDPAVQEYIGINYDPERVIKRFNAFGALFDSKVDLTQNYGYIKKKEVPKGSKIFVRADLHGDLKSLIENLKAMQKEGLLDENFKCKTGTYMVFCGDYMDRGNYSLDVAEFLATLKMENPDQVFLIRGNHEYRRTNEFPFMYKDPNFLQFLNDHPATLDRFYENMPLSLYMAEDGGEFVQFTHGLFELHIDPSKMLESDQTRMVIAKDDHSFSQRVQKLATEKPATLTKYHLAAQRITELKAQEFDRSTEDATVYNWGDVYANRPVRLISLEARYWNLPPEDVKHALRLMSTVRKVKLLFRGHQHQFQHGVHDGKVVVTTLPVGMDSKAYKRFFAGQLDRAYILETDQKVKDWEKRAFLRQTGASEVRITKAYPIFSAEE